MAIRSIVLLAAALLAALPARAQDPFDDATRMTAAACVEPLRPEQLPPCVLALQRQVLQLQAIVSDRGKRLAALEEAVSIIAGNQIQARALAHCHDDQPECAELLRKQDAAGGGPISLPSK
jgi:hypothetical protein